MALDPLSVDVCARIYYKSYINSTPLANRNFLECILKKIRQENVELDSELLRQNPEIDAATFDWIASCVCFTYAVLTEQLGTVPCVQKEVIDSVNNEHEKSLFGPLSSLTKRRKSSRLFLTKETHFRACFILKEITINASRSSKRIAIRRALFLIMYIETQIEVNELEAQFKHKG